MLSDKSVDIPGEGFPNPKDLKDHMSLNDIKLK